MHPLYLEVYKLQLMKQIVTFYARNVSNSEVLKEDLSIRASDADSAKMLHLQGGLCSICITVNKGKPRPPITNQKMAPDPNLTGSNMSVW